MLLYLDIETIPSQSPEVHARIAETVTCPGNITKPESIAKWGEDKKPELVREAIAKTALDGSVGHVCCIGYAIGNDDPKTLLLNTESSEADLILNCLNAIHNEFIAQNRPMFIIGHNVIDFDIRFLWQRAIVLGVRMPEWFPRDPKPWSGEVFDTMTAFAGARNRIGLDRLCLALGMDGKGEIDGSMIGDLWASGQYERIAEYCRADVARTRAVYKRMMVAFGELAA